MSVSVIVLHYGPRHLTDACLASLRQHSPDVQVVLIDNTPPNENLGFAGGCNAGADLADGDVYVFLNNDTEVTAGWLEPILAELEDPTVGAAGPKLIYRNGAVQCAGLRIDFRQWGSEARNLRADWTTKPADVDGVTGACLAVRAELFGLLSGFDEGFWNGYEDVDLCLRVRAAGHRIRYTPNATVIHHESQSDPVERYRKVQQNIARLNRKWGDRWPSPTGTATSTT